MRANLLLSVLRHSLLLCILFLFSHSTEGLAEELSSTTRIYDAVDVITGAYHDYEEDLAIDCPQPFVLSRTYDSTRDNWSFFSHCLIASTEKKNTLQVTASDGTKRNYEKVLVNNIGPLGSPVSEQANCYRLTSEVLPQGSLIHYLYDSNGWLSALQMKSKKGRLFATLSFAYDEQAIHVFSGQLKLVSYCFQNGKLAFVKRVQKPDISYKYYQSRLVRKELPEGRFLAIDYNEEGKVKALTAPNSSTPLFTFRYEPGVTHVFDAKQNKTIFRHQETELTKIEKYQESCLYRTDSFVWKAKKLFGHAVSDGQGKVLEATKYQYNKHSLLSAMQTLSCPIMPSAQGIILDTNDVAKINDIAPQYTYSDDIFHNLIHKQISKTSFVTYEYKMGTNLLAREFVWIDNKMTNSTFYSYDDETGQLLRKEDDDGTYKTVVEMSPRKYLLHTLDTQTIQEKRSNKITDETTPPVCTQNSYDELGRLISNKIYTNLVTPVKSEEFAYDAHHNLTRSVDSLGAVTLYSYDANDNLIEKKECANGRITTFQYDLLNNLVVKNELYPNQEGIVTQSFEYDSQGNIIRTTDRYGSQTEYSYDAFSRLIAITYPRVQNEQGYPIQPQELFTYDIFNGMTSRTDPKGSVTSYIRNSKGKTLEISYPDATCERIRYDEEGLLTHKLEREKVLTKYQYKSPTTIAAVERYTLKADGTADERIFRQEPLQTKKYDYKYDLLQRPIQKIGSIDNASNLVTGKSFSLAECVKYDALDQIIERWIEEPDKTVSYQQSMIYDAFGNVAKIMTGDSFEAIDYVQGNRPVRIATTTGVTHIEYHEHPATQGNYVLEKVITDPQGVVTTLFMDALERVVLVTCKDPYGAPLFQKELFYDAAGNLATTVESGKNKQSPAIRTEWKYDSMDNLVTLQEACGTDVARAQHFSYSKQGLLESISRPQQTSHFSYDTDGNLVKIACANSITTYTYSNAGKLSGGTSTEGVFTRRTYTDCGQIASEEITDAYGSYKVYYIYDKLGRMTCIQLPDGSFIDYVYEGTKLKMIARRFKNFLQRHSCLENREYNDQGLVTSQKLADQNTIQKLTYTKEGALTSKQSPYFSEAILSRDALGNPLQIERQGTKYTFAYDFTNALTEEKSATSCIYAYDAKENAADGVCNALNQLLRKGDREYRYDEQGSLCEVVSPTSSEKLTYNVNAQLTAYQKNNDVPVSYKYDVFGRCQQREENGLVQRYFYIGSSEIGALDATGKITELKVPESISDEIATGVAAIELQGKRYLPLSDLFGNIVSLVDPVSKKSVESYEYTAFGQTENKSYINPFRYRGLRTDAVSGFVMFSYRHYDPSTKRFLTRDPLGYADGSNLYAYVHNNPLRYSDDTGLKALYGPCMCHISDCGFYIGGVCGHGAGVYLGDDGKPEAGDMPQPRIKSTDPISLNETSTQAMLFTGLAAGKGMLSQAGLIDFYDPSTWASFGNVIGDYARGFVDASQNQALDYKNSSMYGFGYSAGQFLKAFDGPAGDLAVLFFTRGMANSPRGFSRVSAAGSRIASYAPKVTSAAIVALETKGVSSALLSSRNLNSMRGTTTLRSIFARRVELLLLLGPERMGSGLHNCISCQQREVCLNL